MDEAVAVRIFRAVQQLPGSPAAAESRSGSIGPINLEAKRAGERSAGNPPAAFDEAGAGNVAWSRCCDTRDRKSETTGNTNIDLNRRASPRPYVCPVKAGMFSRDQSCRGKSQRPRSLDSRVAGNQDSEAYRQGLPRGDYEPLGRNDSERKCGLESEKIRRPSPQPKGEGSMASRNLTDAAFVTSAGWKRQHGGKDMPSNWRSPPRPGEKSSEQGRSYNRPNREVDRRREGGGWVRISDEAE